MAWWGIDAMVIRKVHPLWAWFTMFILIMLAWFGGNVAFSVYESRLAVRQSNHKWCTTLDLLVTKKPPPTATASLRYYVVFKDLHDEFGC